MTDFNPRQTNKKTLGITVSTDTVLTYWPRWSNRIHNF